MTEKKIYIDGTKTREAIDEMTGKSQSMRQLCMEKGLHPESLNRACINGFGSPKIIMKYMRAGIPVILSDRPVPSRLRREHSRGGAAKVPAGEQIDFEAIYPKQFETIKNSETRKMRDILIRHLTEIIKELKEI